MKPKPIPTYDSNQLDRYMREVYRFGTEYEGMLSQIITKVRFEVTNGCVVLLLKDFLYKENYPQLTDEERKYIRIALKEFETNQYGEVQIHFWW